jgi:hypothetical protein
VVEARDTWRKMKKKNLAERPQKKEKRMRSVSQNDAPSSSTSSTPEIGAPNALAMPGSREFSPASFQLTARRRGAGVVPAAVPAQMNWSLSRSLRNDVNRPLSNLNDEACAEMQQFSGRTGLVEQMLNSTHLALRQTRTDNTAGLYDRS